MLLFFPSAKYSISSPELLTVTQACYSQFMPPRLPLNLCKELIFSLFNDVREGNI